MLPPHVVQVSLALCGHHAPGNPHICLPLPGALCYLLPSSQEKPKMGAAWTPASGPHLLFTLQGLAFCLLHILNDLFFSKTFSLP